MNESFSNIEGQPLPENERDRDHESSSVGEVLNETQERLEQAYDEVPEAPETCTLDGRTWECKGDTHMELLSQLVMKAEIVSNLLAEMRERNMQAADGSPEQRATYKTLQWLQTEYDIRAGDLQTTRAQFAQQALERQVVDQAANDEDYSQTTAA